MRTDILFRGCTRPPMFMGVPYIPFFLGAGSCVLLSAWFNLFWLLAIPPVIFVMRMMTRHDEMIFRMFGIRLQFWVKARNRQAHNQMWVFSPNNIQRKNKR